MSSGRAIGAAGSSVPARAIHDPSQVDRFRDGDLLVTVRTDPDWEPILRKATGVTTDQGSRNSHAAIIAREMGQPAIVGCGGRDRGHPQRHRGHRRLLRGWSGACVVPRLIGNPRGGSGAG